MHRNATHTHACMISLIVAFTCAGTAMAADGDAPVSGSRPATPGPTSDTGAAPAREPVGLRGLVQSADQIARFDAPALDLNAIAAEDSQRAINGLPPRFAMPKPVNITPDTQGTWDDLGDGTMLWRLRVTSPNAVSTNLGFTRYKMPSGGMLWFYATDGSEVIRPFTIADNDAHGQLWTPIVRSNDITVEIVIPQAVRREMVIELGFINHGYRGFGKPAPNMVTVASGSCNVDVVCPEGDDWRDEIPAVGVYSTGGSTFCTGFMVNNTAQDLTPFFMTANHCGIGSGNAASLVVYWNYENSTCRPPGSGASGGPGDGSLSQFQTGSTFRASYSPSDMTIVELDDDPDPDWMVSFAGWSRFAGDASSAIAIHHPNTDEKRISFENAATTTTSYLGTSVPGDGTHVRVIDWDLGTTEPGSSGSPLFNQDHQVIGQLHGGFAACGNNDSDWYGRFSLSWTGGGSSASRLSNWLDPGNTGAITVDTISGAGLSVSPSASVLHIGQVGGPFTDPSIVYTLSNPSPMPVDYKVALTADFGILLDGGTLPVTGTLAAMGGSTTVTVSLSPAIDALAAGVYVEDVVFEDLTNVRSLTVTHTVEVGQTNFTVTPASGLESGGPVGGPFNGSQAYTITSTRPSPVAVKLSASDSWISLNGGAGPVTLNLSGTGDSDVVVVAYSSDADSLTAGIYNGTVSVTNESGGDGGTSRSVSLDVGRLVYPSTDTPQAINDNSTITSNITVADNYCIGDVDVDLDITHTYIGDLRVTLTSPLGTVVTLHDRTGGDANDIVTTYDDETNPPDGPGALSDFDFENSAGVWTLTVSDNAGQDTGALNEWSLRIAVQPGDCPTPQLFHSFPLDSDPGWATQGQWAFGVPTGGGSNGGDPTSGATGSNVYGYNLAGDYANNIGSVNYLTSSAIDCSAILSTRLKFQRWLGVESSSFDHANVQVSNNGTAWTSVWDHSGGSFNDNAWIAQSFDISAVADGQSTVFVRWGMGTTDGSVTYPGWNIDDIGIWGIPSLLDCNNNGVPDDEDITLGTSEDCNTNDIPDECDIAGGNSEDCDGNETPDECECVPALSPLAEVGGVVKSRYISLEPSGSSCPAALRVLFDSLPVAYQGLEGQWMWIGPVQSYPEGDSGGSFDAAGLQCTPHFADWSSVGLFHVFNSAIIPGATYRVQALRTGCDPQTAAPGDYSAALDLPTAQWGDVRDPFGGSEQPNFADITAVVDKFKDSGNATALVSADLRGPGSEGSPNMIDQKVDFADISVDVDAFKGNGFPFGMSACSP